jgi:hypothetical protein
MLQNAPASGQWLPRRTFLRAVAWAPALAACFRSARGDPSAVRGGEIRTALEGFRRTEVFRRRYNVNATILMLGLPVFSRRDVGGGYASVELGSARGVQAVALQFAAGAWPQRAAGLNRFGVLKEALIQEPECAPASFFAGLISASGEATLEEARKALHTFAPVVDITVTRGGSSEGRAWSQTEDLPTPAPQSWMEAEGLLNQLLRRESASPIRERDAAGAAPFLGTIRRAALCSDREFRGAFFHASKRFVLEARWEGGSPRELSGVIRYASGAKSAEFRAFYPAGDSSGLPLRIEYRPRSYLKLTFEADPDAELAAIPSLFPEAANP